MPSEHTNPLIPQLELLLTAATFCISKRFLVKPHVPLHLLDKEKSIEQVRNILILSAAIVGVISGIFGMNLNNQYIPVTEPLQFCKFNDCDRVDCLRALHSKSVCDTAGMRIHTRYSAGYDLLPAHHCRAWVTAVLIYVAVQVSISASVGAISVFVAIVLWCRCVQVRNLLSYGRHAHATDYKLP